MLGLEGIDRPEYITELPAGQEKPIRMLSNLLIGEQGFDSLRVFSQAGRGQLG